MNEHDIALRMAWFDLRQFLSTTLSNEAFGELLVELSDPLRELFAPPPPMAFDALTRPEREIATKAFAKLFSGQCTRALEREAIECLTRVCGAEAVAEALKVHRGGRTPEFVEPVEKWFVGLSERDKHLETSNNWHGGP